jgi:hypothetical protein
MVLHIRQARCFASFPVTRPAHRLAEMIVESWIGSQVGEPETHELNGRIKPGNLGPVDSGSNTTAVEVPECLRLPIVTRGDRHSLKRRLQQLTPQ